MAKYQDWSKRLVSGAQNWFMGELLIEPLLKTVQELKDDNDKLRGDVGALRAEMATLIATLKKGSE